MHSLNFHTLQYISWIFSLNLHKYQESMLAFFSAIKSISQIFKNSSMELTNYFIDILGTLSDYLTGQSQLYFFRYFSLFSFTSLWKTLCKVKDLWCADLTPWTVSMKEGRPISHVTCCTIQMQIGSCNINCLNQFCKSCKFGGPGKRAAPIYKCTNMKQCNVYVFIYIYTYIYRQIIPNKVLCII